MENEGEPAGRDTATVGHSVWAGSPDLVIAKRLLDHLTQGGFQFQRVAPGEDGPLVGHRVTSDWADTIHIGGFSCDCLAWRQRTSSLIVPGNVLVERRTHGSALNVFNEVLTWETDRDFHTSSLQGNR